MLTHVQLMHCRVAALRSSGSHVPPQHRLAAVLRYFAGGCYLDIEVIHGMTATTLSNTVHQFLTDFASDTSIPEYRLHFPISETSKLSDLEKGFAALTGGVDLLAEDDVVLRAAVKLDEAELRLHKRFATVR